MRFTSKKEESLQKEGIASQCRRFFLIGKSFLSIYLLFSVFFNGEAGDGMTEENGVCQDLIGPVPKSPEVGVIRQANHPSFPGSADEGGRAAGCKLPQGGVTIARQQG